MAEKDLLQAIRKGLAEPIKSVEPIQFDNEAIERAMSSRHSQVVFPPYSVTRNSRVTFKDELAKDEAAK